MHVGGGRGQCPSPTIVLINFISIYRSTFTLKSYFYILILVSKPCAVAFFRGFVRLNQGILDYEN